MWNLSLGFEHSDIIVIVTSSLEVFVGQINHFDQLFQTQSLRYFQFWVISRICQHNCVSVD